MKKERVLAFGPHPDDVEIKGAGTLVLLAEMGYEIHVAVMAGGEMGSPTLPPARIRAIRMKEAARAAASIGARFHFAGGHDIEIDYNQAYRRRAVRVVREVDPLIVFTTPPLDYLIDHEETSRLVRNACYVAPVRNYYCGVPTKPTNRIPYLYYYNASDMRDIFGRPLPLTCAVDISSVIGQKSRMLACHASQGVWLSHLNKITNFVTSMQRTAKIEGHRAGFKMAETFIQHLGSGHPQDNILKKILGARCKEFRKTER